MNGFVKLYETILDSSIWNESAATRLVWITMLAMADQHGKVEASVGGLARRAQVSREECEAALVVLSSPDADDKSGVDEGRRIRKVDRGWVITNHKHYREFRTEKQVKGAERAQRHRDRNKGVTRNASNASSRGVRPEAEAEAEAERDQKAAAKDLTGSARAPEQAAAAGDLDLDPRERAAQALRSDTFASWRPETWPEVVGFVDALSESWRRVALSAGHPLIRLLVEKLAGGVEPADLAAAGTHLGRWLSDPGPDGAARTLAMATDGALQHALDEVAGEGQQVRALAERMRERRMSVVPTKPERPPLTAGENLAAALQGMQAAGGKHG